MQKIKGGGADSTGLQDIQDFLIPSCKSCL